MTAGTAVVLAAVAGLATAGLGGGGGTPAAHATLPPATAGVERTTLVETQKVDGTLGYGDATAAPSGGAQGTCTWIAAPGRVLARGDVAYRVDGRKVPVLYGALPIYRTLRDGVTGPDVRQLERNLSALGYTGFTVDTTFSAATAAAVEEWQEDLGLTENGQVKPGDAVVTRGAVRVAERKAQVGERVGGTVFTYTGTSRVVSVDLDVQYQRLVRKGAGVSVELPGEPALKGRVTSVGKVATKGGQDDPTTIPVTVAVSGGRIGAYDKAPVKVYLTTGERRNVLAVPVGALLARGDGGYAVQVVQGGTSRQVPVETGVFAGGRVEVSGGGLAAGMKVGVPS
ncbi:peptidoglycan-binding protein [Actinomadura sp. PM05-2]|uniref:Peptidoglycan-binding protein n=1 Tax=Actinomadura parmotrematis TaxID=2864039 RepID=A0ABS7FY53_9ACTN|nr:peptidoglycan-binding protein [Actinomadura parmotrematis]